MNDLQYQFSSLSSSVDELHEVLDRWSQNEYRGGALSTEMKVRMRLIVHEWIANLVQHANFENRHPEVSLQVDIRSESRVDVAILDNSAGFTVGNKNTLKEKLDTENLPSERGLGLPLIVACTRGLEYQCPKDQENRLEFQLVGGDNHV